MGSAAICNGRSSTLSTLINNRQRHRETDIVPHYAKSKITLNQKKKMFSKSFDELLQLSSLLREGLHTSSSCFNSTLYIVVDNSDA